MNWGYKILFLYLGFLIFVLTMVYMSMNQQVDLVSPDYYDREIAFQKQIDAGKNSMEAQAGWRLEVDASRVRLLYSKPADAARLNGTVLFFRSSDAAQDRREKLQTAPDGSQSFDVTSMKKGAWKVVLEWQVDGKAYYEEKNIFIP